MALSSLYHREIRHNSLFNHLSDECFKYVLKDAGLIVLEKNELLYECGFEANHFFLVRTGQVTLFQTSYDGNEKIVDIYEAGQVFAEAAMFSKESGYPTHARASSTTELFYFDVNHFKQKLKQSNELCFSMLSEMGKRLQEQTQEIVELSIHDAQYRLIRYFLEKSCKENTLPCEPFVILSTTKSQLASRLSITPETFSRILSRLKKQGLITINDVTITLKEPEKLRAMIGQQQEGLPEKCKKYRHNNKLTRKQPLLHSA